MQHKNKMEGTEAVIFFFRRTTRIKTTTFKEIAFIGRCQHIYTLILENINKNFKWEKKESTFLFLFYFHHKGLKEEKKKVTFFFTKQRRGKKTKEAHNLNIIIKYLYFKKKIYLSSPIGLLFVVGTTKRMTCLDLIEV